MIVTSMIVSSSMDFLQNTLNISVRVLMKVEQKAEKVSWYTVRTKSCQNSS